MIPFPFQAGQFGRSGSGVLWTPRLLGTVPPAWYNDESSISIPSGSEVSALGSLGSANFDLSQSVSANRPARVLSGLNGRRTILFDGSNDRMATSAIQAQDQFRNVSTGFVAAVYKKTAAGAGANQNIAINYTNGSAARFTLGCNDPTAGRENRPRLSVRRLDADSVGVLAASSGGSTAWQMVIATMDWANGDGTLYVDGTQDAQNLALTSSGSTSNTQANLPFTLGAANDGTTASDIELAEYLQVAYLPSASEIEKLFGYFAHRWALTSALPSGHPYKTMPPTL
jgi:hypothetical protein